MDWLFLPRLEFARLFAALFDAPGCRHSIMAPAAAGSPLDGAYVEEHLVLQGSGQR